MSNKVFTITASEFFGGLMPETTRFVGVVTGVDSQEAADKVAKELQSRGYYGIGLSWREFGVVYYSGIVPGKGETQDCQYDSELRLVDEEEESPAEIPVIIWDYNDLSPVIGWPDKLTAQIMTAPSPLVRLRLATMMDREPSTLGALLLKEPVCDFCKEEDKMIPAEIMLELAHESGYSTENLRVCSSHYKMAVSMLSHSPIGQGTISYSVLRDSKWSPWTLLN